MTLLELRRQLNNLINLGYGSTQVESIFKGKDWDSGKIFIQTTLPELPVKIARTQIEKEKNNGK